MGVPLIEATQHIKDQSPILDDLAKITQIICHRLHPHAIVSNGQVTLLEKSKHSVELECLGFVVPTELLLDANPGDARRVLPNTDSLHEFGRQGAEQPGPDHRVHAPPCRDVQGGSVEEDVVVEGVALESEDHQIAPAIVVS